MVDCKEKHSKTALILYPPEYLREGGSVMRMINGELLQLSICLVRRILDSSLILVIVTEFAIPLTSLFGHPFRGQALHPYFSQGGSSQFTPVLGSATGLQISQVNICFFFSSMHLLLTAAGRGLHW